MINRKILIACDNVPGNGGANTAGYRLFEMLQRDGIDASYVNLLFPSTIEYLQYVFGPSLGNPRALEGVHNCYIDRPPYRPEPRHQQLVDLVEQYSPDVMLGIDFPASFLLKHASPDRPLVYLTAGCSQLMTRIERGIAHDAISFQRTMASSSKPEITHWTESAAVELADLVLTHSTLMQELYRFFFRSQTGKIDPDVFWYADWICDEAREFTHLAQPFEERDVDVLFVANRWDRTEKNWPMVKKIIRKLKGRKIHLVGESAKIPRGVEHYGFVTDREQLFGLLGRSKAVVSASLVDAAPGILFEAATLGANVIASRNCGNWRLCHDSLLAAAYHPTDFVRCIERAITKKYSDQLDDFLRQRSYDKLVNTLAVI